MSREPAPRSLRSPRSGRKLERRVSQLRSESLDLDLLDQEARRLLNLGHPDEEVLFHDRPAQPGPDQDE